MKKLFLAILILCSVQLSAQYYTYVGPAYEWRLGMFRALGLPSGDTPAFIPGQTQRAGQLFYDTLDADAGLYIWNGLAWSIINPPVTVPTWQETLTAGLTLTGDNAIDLNGGVLSFNQGGNYLLYIDPINEVSVLRSINTTGGFNTARFATGTTNLASNTSLEANFNGGAKLVSLALLADASTAKGTFNADSVLFVSDINVSPTYRLHLGSNASDLTNPVVGDMFYNTATNKFRGYENGAWANMIGGGAAAFTSLTDVPATYTGQALKITRVNAGETALEFVPLIGSIGISTDGQGGVVSTGSKGFITIPYNATITNWYVVADISGSVQFDIKRSGVSIVGAGNKPLLSAAISGNAAVSGWTSVVITAGDILEWVIDSASTLTKATLTLKITK